MGKKIKLGMVVSFGVGGADKVALNLVKGLRILLKKNFKIKNVGIRHGEKIHETLLSSREYSTAEIKDGYFHISITGQAKHLYYVGQHVIPSLHFMVMIQPIQGQAMCVFSTFQDTQSLCVGQHWPNPLCKTTHSL